MPLPPLQKRAILRLMRALIKSMSTASSDPKHPGVRYSSALDRLLGLVYRNQANQTPAITRPPSPRMGTATGAAGNSTDAAVGSPRNGEYDLSALLGSKESPFVAERPLQDLATDIDAFFDYAPDDPGVGMGMPVQGGDLSAILPSSDIFAPLFGNYEAEFWQPFTPTALG